MPTSLFRPDGKTLHIILSHSVCESAESVPLMEVGIVER